MLTKTGGDEAWGSIIVRRRDQSVEEWGVEDERVAQRQRATGQHKQGEKREAEMESEPRTTKGGRRMEKRRKK